MADHAFVSVMPSLDTFLTVLETLPGHNLTVNDALRIVFTVAELVPLLIRGRAQRTAPRGRLGVTGAWFALSADLFSDAFGAALDVDSTAETAEISLDATNLENIAENLHFFNSEDNTLLDSKSLQSLLPPKLLISPHVNCLYCSTPRDTVPLHFRKRDRKDVCIGPTSHTKTDAYGNRQGC